MWTFAVILTLKAPSAIIEAMTERERIIERVADSIAKESKGRRNPLLRIDALALAEVALRELEAPASKTETYSRICSCGQNGFPENSPYSNHPHETGCPQYISK